MIPAEFKRKWARYSGKETAAYQEHFNDLCALLGQPSPAGADPTGSESFCFQKRVVKDAELFALDHSGRVAEEPDADRERGFADVWKKGCFAWEYKGKKKNLDAAYQKLGTRLETRPRYTPTSCFETFPFPEPNEKQKIDISTAAKELNELRENWLNPPEWTTTRVLEFPGAIHGPWSRFVVDPDARGIGTARYPRLESRNDDYAKKLAKRILTNLYNERPTWLANAHAKLDAAVAAAYGFPVDLTDEQIPERLLALNQQRSADEKPATRKQPRDSRARTGDEFV